MRSSLVLFGSYSGSSAYHLEAGLASYQFVISIECRSFSGVRHASRHAGAIAIALTETLNAAKLVANAFFKKLDAGIASIRFDQRAAAFNPRNWAGRCHGAEYD